MNAKIGLTLLLMLTTPVVLAAEAKIGAPAPAFTLTDTAGNPRALSEFAGKTVVLEWTNHECPFVMKHYNGENMQRQQAGATSNGVVWLVVNSSAPGKQGHVSPKQAEKIQAEWNARQTHYLFDTAGDTGQVYGAKVTPHMYVIDGEGILRYNGAIDSIPSANPSDLAKAEQFVEIALAELAAGKPVTRALTQPYGCSIKY